MAPFRGAARLMSAALVLVPLSSCQSPSELAAVPDDPVVKTGTLLRPRFETTEGTADTGHAFVVQHGESTVLLSAHHILGRPGGLSKAINWKDVPTAVTRVIGKTVDGEGTVTATRALAIEGARPLDPRDPSSDLSAFLVEDAGGVPTLELAQANSENGEFVWLFAEIQGYVGRDKLLHRGSVSASTEKELRFIFADRQLKLKATSGAPILNAKGEVVAVNLGGGSNLGLTFGVGNPVSSVRKRLDKALK